MEINYITKEEMLVKRGEPYFGYTQFTPVFHFSTGSYIKTEYEADVIDIRSDLPKSVQESVLGHEMVHATDTEFMNESVLFREAKAWIGGLKANPVGFFYGILLSLSPERIKLYLKRIMKGF